MKLWCFFSNDMCGFVQLLKYGIVGVMATVVQIVVFYSFATNVFSCLASNDWAVKYLGFSAANVSDETRGLYFVVCTTFAFIISNFFCWIMNRIFVFKPGKFNWCVELGLFYASATIASVISIGFSWLCINYFGLMTTMAVAIEIGVSFLCNYFARKFVIFRD